MSVLLPDLMVNKAVRLVALHYLQLLSCPPMGIKPGASPELRVRRGELRTRQGQASHRDTCPHIYSQLAPSQVGTTGGQLLL